MLAAAAEPTTQFTRRDAGRLIAASALLIVAMSVILGIDFLPAQPRLEAGKPAPRARPGAARRRVHERRPHQAAARRRQRGDRAPVRLHVRGCRRGRRRSSCARSTAKVAPVDAAFADGVTPADHTAILKSSLPDLIDGRADHAPGPDLDALDRRPHRGRPGPRDGRARRAPRQPGRLDQRVRSPGAWPATSTPTSGRSPPRSSRPLIAPELVVLDRPHEPGPRPGRRGRPAGHQELGARRDHRPGRRPRG